METAQEWNDRQLRVDITSPPQLKCWGTLEFGLVVITYRRVSRIREEVAAGSGRQQRFSRSHQLGHEGARA